MMSLTAPSVAGSRVDGGHIFSSYEVAFSQGWPTGDFPENRVYKCYKDCMAFNVEDASTHAQAQMQGNGVHLAALSAWQLYVYSHVMRKDLLNKLTPCLTWKRPQLPQVIDNSQDAEPEEEAIASPSRFSQILPEISTDLSGTATHLPFALDTHSQLESQIDLEGDRQLESPLGLECDMVRDMGPPAGHFAQLGPAHIVHLETLEPETII